MREKLSALPAVAVLQSVADAMQGGFGRTATAAATGSGKTLLVPTAVADASKDRVLVLVPRRYLAINAAENVAMLSGGYVVGGPEVGYAVGARGQDISQFGPDTQVVYATYGYALRAGWLGPTSPFRKVFFDEIHEESLDASIALAILLHGIEHRGDIRDIGLMSATYAPDEYKELFSGIGELDVFPVEGSSLSCDFHHVKPDKDGMSLEQVALNLVIEQGRRGIAIFRAGEREVKETAEAIRQLHRKILADGKALDQIRQRATQEHRAKFGNQQPGGDVPTLEAYVEAAVSGLKNLEIEVIYGKMDAKQRADAIAAPKKDGAAKILIGTNVIESGVTIPWLDSGISDGTGKIPSYLRGSSELLMEDLPQWRLIQQMGRIGRVLRDIKGTFILYADKSLEERPLRLPPEIERAALEVVVMHCAAAHVLPEELKFNAKIERGRFVEARRNLQALGLVTKDWRLTEAGEFAHQMPISPENAAMLWQARRMAQSGQGEKQGIMADAIELAAILEVRGMREDARQGHGLHVSSDVLDSLAAFRLSEEYEQQHPGDEEGLNALMERYNVSARRYRDAQLIIQELREYQKPEDLKPGYRATEDDQLKIMLAGNVHRLFSHEHGTFHPVFLKEADSCKSGNYSVLNQAGSSARFAIGQQRGYRGTTEGETKKFIADGSILPEAVLLEFLAERPDLVNRLEFNRDSDGNDIFYLSYGQGSRQLRFVVKDVYSPLIRPLIEEGYTRFLIGKTGEYLKGALELEDAEVAAAVQEARNLQELADRLILPKLYGTGAEMRVIAGKTGKDEDWVTLGRIPVNPHSPGGALELQVKAGQLTARSFAVLLEDYPALLPYGVGRGRAMQLNGDTLTIYSLKTEWDGEAVASAALAKGHSVNVVPVVRHSLPRMREKYFHEVFDSKDYGDSDREYALQVMRDYTTGLERIGAIREMSAHVRESDDFLVPKTVEFGLERLSESLAFAQRELASAAAVRKKLFKETLDGLKKSLRGVEILVGKAHGGGYRQEAFTIISQPDFPDQCANALTLYQSLAAWGNAGELSALNPVKKAERDDEPDSMPQSPPLQNTQVTLNRMECLEPGLMRITLTCKPVANNPMAEAIARKLRDEAAFNGTRGEVLIESTRLPPAHKGDNKARTATLCLTVRVPRQDVTLSTHHANEANIIRTLPWEQDRLKQSVAANLPPVKEPEMAAPLARSVRKERGRKPRRQQPEAEIFVREARNAALPLGKSNRINSY